MFGNKANDGFLDGLARTIASYGAVLAIIGIILYLKMYYDIAVKTKNYKVVTTYWVIIIGIILYIIIATATREPSLMDGYINIPKS